MNDYVNSSKHSLFLVTMSLLSKLNRFHLLYLIVFLTPYLDKTDNDINNSIKRVIFMGLVSLALLFAFADIPSKSSMNLKIPKINIYLFSIYIIIFFSVIFAYNPAEALIHFRTLNFGIILMVIISKINNEKVIKKIINTILFSAIPITIFAIYQIIFKVTFYKDMYPRINSIFWDPNIFGLFLLVACSYIFPIIFTRARYKSIFIIFFIILSIMLFLTYSRTALISLFLVSIYYFFINKKYKLLFIFFLFSVGFSFILVKFSTEIRFAVSDGQEMFSILYRIDLIRGGINMFLDNIILGVGLENFNLIFHQYIEPGMFLIPGLYSIHSWPIQILAEHGILAIILVILLLIQFNKQTIILISSSDIEIKILLQRTFLAFISFWIFGLAYHSFLRYEFFWVVFGVYLASLKISVIKLNEKELWKKNSL